MKPTIDDVLFSLMLSLFPITVLVVEQADVPLLIPFVLSFSVILLLSSWLKLMRVEEKELFNHNYAFVVLIILQLAMMFLAVFSKFDLLTSSADVWLYSFWIAFISINVISLRSRFWKNLSRYLLWSLFMVVYVVLYFFIALVIAFGGTW